MHIPSRSQLHEQTCMSECDCAYRKQSCTHATSCSTYTYLDIGTYEFRGFTSKFGGSAGRAKDHTDHYKRFTAERNHCQTQIAGLTHWPRSKWNTSVIAEDEAFDASHWPTSKWNLPVIAEDEAFEDQCQWRHDQWHHDHRWGRHHWYDQQSHTDGYWMWHAHSGSSSQHWRAQAQQSDYYQ
jgi:hypothetical protein